MQNTTDPSKSYLKVFLLGPPALEWDNQSLFVPRRLARALIYRLALSPHPVSREHLCWIFWPDSPEKTARRNLTHLLTHIRRALPRPHILLSQGEQVELDPKSVWCDAAVFRQILQSPLLGLEPLYNATGLYRGPFLAGFSLPEAAEFEIWASTEQVALEHAYLKALELLIDQETALQDYALARQAALRYLETDDLAEHIHCQLMALYAASGERHAALRQYERCVAVLERELGIDPLPETRAVYLSILSGDIPALGISKGRPDKALPEVGKEPLPFVGRQAAHNSLSDALNQASNGVATTVLVSGEPGMGKSRLIHEFIVRLQIGAQVLFSSGYPAGHTVPYQPLVDAIRSAADHLPGLFDLDPVWLAELSRLFPELRTRHPNLPLPLPSEPEDARTRLFEALTRLVFWIASTSPVTILCLDDLQWIDRTTLEWLGYLSHQLHGKSVRLFILTGARDDGESSVDAWRHNLEQIGMLNEVKLTGLDDAAISKLLQFASGGSSQEMPLVARLKSATGGNPFFLRELLNALIDENRTDGIATLDKFPLPPGLKDAIEGRLQQLDPMTCQVLEAGAVLGPAFDFDRIFNSAGRSEDETLDSLERLCANHILVDEAGQYHFTHDLFRQAVEARLKPVRKQLLHRRVGRVLEKLDPAATNALAYHFEAGGDLARAIHYHGLAAQQAEALFAWQEAEKHHTLLLKLLAATDPGCRQSGCRAQRGQILSRRAHLYYLQGRLAERDADLAALSDLAESCDDPALRVLAKYHHTRYLNLGGRYAEAIAAAREGLAVALDDPPAHCQLLVEIGFAHYFLGQPRPGLVALEAALALAGAAAGPDVRGSIVHQLGYIYLHLGEYQQALDYQQEAYACHLATRDNNGMAWAGLDIGFLHLRLGRFSDAERYLNESLALARRIGARPAEAYALTYLGYWEFYRGNNPAAVAWLQESLPIHQAVHQGHGAAAAMTGLGLAVCRLGDMPQARGWLESAIEQARSIDHRRRLTEALIGLGMLEIEAGDCLQARRHLDEAVTIARETDNAENLAAGHAALARLERLEAVPDRALAHALEAIRTAQRLNLVTCEMWGEMELGLALLALDRPLEAIEHSRRTAALTVQAHAGWIPLEQVHRAHAQITFALGASPASPKDGLPTAL